MLLSSPLLSSYLVGDAVDVLALLVDLVAHVLRHGLQVADEAAHGVQVLLHLVLAGVVGDPVDVGSDVSALGDLISDAPRSSRWPPHLLMYWSEGAEAFTWPAWPLRTPDGCRETTLEPVEPASPFSRIPQVRLYFESCSIDDTLKGKARSQQLNGEVDIKELLH